MSRLVVSDVITQPDVTKRVQVIEKWSAVADICRCLHNFNGVLQICAAFTNSSVFRLKNTWNRVSKSVNITSILALFNIIYHQITYPIFRRSRPLRSSSPWCPQTAGFATWGTRCTAPTLPASRTSACTSPISPSSRKAHPTSRTTGSWTLPKWEWC